MKPTQLIGKSGRRKPKIALELTLLQQDDLKKVSKYLPRALAVFRKAYSSISMAAGVKAKCLECSNLQIHEVEICKIEGCPLWRYRPYQKK